ncbi:unnamed protein product [Triticum turgidum subsp. durum]|uniref:tryptophan synthase n=1 Tax=Triticum turgidum subsp. durum TaxID=4567 RepID=A0A9R0SAB7_TRITD|nr:unnamed protein product [Triticum turgidum subsp. durum]
MAFALNASCYPSSFQSSLLPRRMAAAVMIPRRRNVLPVIRAVAVAPPAPAPAKPAAVRSRPVSVTMAKLMAKGKTALIPYITAGDPDLATTAEALHLLDACGADVIELGVPCSDPYVDGPIIQASSARALAGGATMDGVLAMLKEVTPELSCPVVLFSYYRPILCRGLAEIKEAGVHGTGATTDPVSLDLMYISFPGLIVPDLPYVAAHALWSEAKKNNLELVLLTTPAIPEERMKGITKASEGFIYLVSVNGVTGPRENVNLRVESLIQEIKKVTDKPVAVGFGISKPEHVKQHSCNYKHQCTWTDCRMGCGWGDHWQCDGEAVG